MLRKKKLNIPWFIAFRNEAVRPIYEQWVSLYTVYVLICYISKLVTLCDVQSFAQLLQAPQEEADMKEHFAVPRLVVCNLYGSQVISLLFFVCSSLDLNTLHFP
jgi:hypothetical protein